MSNFAERLESHLGDPFDSNSAVSFQRIVELDEREEFPSEFIGCLRQAGAHQYLIPRELGGSLASFEESAVLLRSISRRDLTAAIAFGQTFLGSIPLWLAGSETQRQALAASIRSGALGCLALTEELHGGDLTASDFQAVREDGRYLLSGRKWLINNGGGGDFATVFARTSQDAGISAYSLVYLDRSQAGATGFQPLAKIHTHGIRGADISGFECSALSVPESAIVGAEGRGYEITLKTLQISRTMCAALSLGAGDTALRVALDFALHRKVFGDTVANIPVARAQLAGAYVDLLICECLSLVMARAIQVCPERLSIWSSAVKYLVPVMVEDLIRESAIVLGARHYLRESFHSGVFQKAMRDNAVVGLFDGSSAVNLHIISGQLMALMAKRGTSTDRPQRLRSLFDRSSGLAWQSFPPASRLSFTNNGFDEIVDGLRDLDITGMPPLVEELREELHTLERDWAVASSRPANSVQRFALAKRYCLILAASACVHTWKYNPPLQSGDWLTAAMQRILQRLNNRVVFETPESLFQQMAEQFHQKKQFSL